MTDRHVVVGADVEPNRHLFEVADLSEVLAIGRVFEGQIGRVSVGQEVRVRVPSYPEEVFDGLVERLGGLSATQRQLTSSIKCETNRESPWQVQQGNSQMISASLLPRSETGTTDIETGRRLRTARG